MSTVSAEYVRDRFFLGFIAALAMAGVSSIDAAGDAHQRKFDTVAEKLRERAAGTPASPDVLLPRYLPRSQITGRYKDFDDALVLLQGSLLQPRHPYRATIELNHSEALLQAIRKQFSTAENQALDELAEAYAAAGENETFAFDDRLYA